MWKVTKRRPRLNIRWLCGHSGDVGNGIADRLADEVTRRELKHRSWRRCPLRGWDEEGFIKKIVSIERETTVCKDALKTRWNGPTSFSRTDAVPHKPVRALRTLTTAIAKSAIAWRTAKRGKAAPKQPGVERRCEKDHHKEEKTVYRTVQSSSTDARKQTDFNLKKAVEAGAPPRLQGPSPPTRARSWRSWVRMAPPRRWKTKMAAQVLSTSTSRTYSRIRGRKKFQNGYGSDGHMRSHNLCRKENDKARQAVCLAPLNPFGNDPDEEKPRDDCTVPQKVQYQTGWKRKSRCGILDKIVQSAGSRIAIWANKIICNHHLRHRAKRLH